MTQLLHKKTANYVIQAFYDIITAKKASEL